MTNLQKLIELAAGMFFLLTMATVLVSLMILTTP